MHRETDRFARLATAAGDHWPWTGGPRLDRRGHDPEDVA